MPSAFDFLDFRACLQSVTSDEETTADGVASDVNCAEEADAGISSDESDCSGGGYITGLEGFRREHETGGKEKIGGEDNTGDSAAQGEPTTTDIGGEDSTSDSVAKNEPANTNNDVKRRLVEDLPAELVINVLEQVNVDSDGEIDIMVDAFSNRGTVLQAIMEMLRKDGDPTGLHHHTAFKATCLAVEDVEVAWEKWSALFAVLPSLGSPRSLRLVIAVSDAAALSTLDRSWCTSTSKPEARLLALSTTLLSTLAH